MYMYITKTNVEGRGNFNGVQSSMSIIYKRASLFVLFHLTYLVFSLPP